MKYSRLFGMNNSEKIKTIRFTLAAMEMLAHKKGGRCLSRKYHEGKMVWVCGNGHQWKAKAQDIIYNKWCPICS